MGKGFLHRAEDFAATIGDLCFKRPPTQREQELAERLRHDLMQMASICSNQLPIWKESCDQLINLATHCDPRYFKRWPPIAETMVGRTTPYAVEHYLRIRRSPDFTSTWAKALFLPPHGHAPPFLVDPRTDAISVQHAVNLRQFSSVSGRSFLNSKTIVEFGGGYGSMCRMAQRLGFSGRYVIFDQPPILALQRYYLGLHGFEAEYGPNAKAIALCSTLADAASLITEDTGLMSTWALSEMPLDLRSEIEVFFKQKGTRSALIAYQHQFEGIDNTSYFLGFETRTSTEWRWQRVESSPTDTYLIGSRLN